MFFTVLSFFLGLGFFSYSFDHESRLHREILLASAQAEKSKAILQVKRSKQTNKQGFVPPFFLNKKEPQAIGLILAFKTWPAGKARTALLKKLQTAGLKKKAEYEMFKTWVYEWPDWRKAEQAKKLCKEFSNLPFIDYCEPDYFLEPASEGSLKVAPKLNPPPVPQYPNFSSVSSGNNVIYGEIAPRKNVKSCKIVSSKLKLYRGQLGDYWAQERVGADLLKEELKKAPQPTKHLVAVFDNSFNHHNVGVKNLISGSGLQATLPPLGKSITVHDVYRSSSHLAQSNQLLRTADKICSRKTLDSRSQSGDRGQTRKAPASRSNPGDRGQGGR